MTTTVAEIYRGRSGDKLNSRQINYLVTGSGGDADLSETVALDAATTASPADVDNLSRTNATIVQHLGLSWFIIGIQYGEAGFDGIATTPGTVEYEFNFQAESEHVYLSLGTRSYGAGADVPWNFKGAINVRKVNGAPVVEGLDLPAGNPTNVWSYTVNRSALSTAYEQTVEGLMGTTNSSVFKGRPISTMRFVSCQTSFISSSKAIVRFGFQFKPHLTGLVLAGGAITGVELKGHELLWGYFEEEVAQPNPNNFGVVQYPRYVYAEKVFRDGNHSMLGIG